MRDKIKAIRLISKNLFFIVLASLMIIVTGAFVIYGIVFLGSSLESALEAPSVAQTRLQFNIQEFEKLNLIQK